MLFHQDRDFVTPQMSLNAASMVRMREMAAKTRPAMAVTPMVPKRILPTKSTMFFTAT